MFLSMAACPTVIFMAMMMLIAPLHGVRKDLDRLRCASMLRMGTIRRCSDGSEGIFVPVRQESRRGQLPKSAESPMHYMATGKARGRQKGRVETYAYRSLGPAYHKYCYLFMMF
jgi:hypothetical protein